MVPEPFRRMHEAFDIDLGFGSQPSDGIVKQRFEVDLDTPPRDVLDQSKTPVGWLEDDFVGNAGHVSERAAGRLDGNQPGLVLQPGYNIRAKHTFASSGTERQRGIGLRPI